MGSGWIGLADVRGCLPKEVIRAHRMSYGGRGEQARLELRAASEGEPVTKMEALWQHCASGGREVWDT